MTAENGYNRPLPTPGKLTAPYWEAAKNHEFKLQKCDECGHIWFPPAVCCPQCLSESFTWTAMSGRAQIWSWIDMWQMYYRGFADERPYTVAYVELEEGPRLMSSIVGLVGSELRVGMPLEVVFDDVTDEITLPKFRSAE
jgi:uncharacterized OB-fold protein